MASSRILNTVERFGNRLPNPTYLFIVLCGVVLIASGLAALAQLSAIHPTTGETLQAVNLLSTYGLHQVLAHTVSNFVQFAPVGTVLVAVMGIAIAEHSGLIGAALKVSLLNAPPKLMTFVVVLAGVLSSLAADTGYVVLIPLAGILFHHAGRNPLLGILATFAGVSGGFSANLMIGPVDAALAGISTEAAHLVDPHYTVDATGNYFFIVASTLLIALVGTWVSEAIIAKRLPPAKTSAPPPAASSLTLKERRALKWTAVLAISLIALLLLGLIPETGVLRDPETGSIVKSPFIQGVVTLVAVFAALCGIAYGRLSGQYQKVSDCIEGMEQHMALMAGYLVLMFFAAQFVHYFAWSNLGAILAIQGAAVLKAFALPDIVLLTGFIAMAALINLFVGSASAKWALIAPIFVPMLMLSGISPEATQMAYRIGDSSTNIITPLMPYFGVVVAFAQKYQKDIGIGSIMANMLPYSFAFLCGWTLLFIAWSLLGLPLGPGAYLSLGR